MIKSLTIITLTVFKIFYFLGLGGHGLGWMYELLVTAFGWVLHNGGVSCLCRCYWEGHYMGWDGGIRGERVDKPFRYSGSCLVACFFLISWSLGFFVVFVSSLSLRYLSRGHLVFGYVSGIDLCLGDIRKDQLGGMSFRCNPACPPTPMLETSIRIRNLSICVSYFCLGLGWTEGWVRGLDSLVNLGWDMNINLMLLYLGTGIWFVKGAKSWLHQIGICSETSRLVIRLVRPRGNSVIKSWVMLFNLQRRLVGRSQYCVCIRLARQFGCTLSSLRDQYSAVKTWMYCWAQVLWLGSIVKWKVYNMRYKYWQPIRSFILYKKLEMSGMLMVCVRGIIVRSGWVRQYTGLLGSCWGYWSYYRMWIKQDTTTVRSRGNIVQSGWVKYFVDVLVVVCRLIKLWCILCGDCKWLDVLSGSSKLQYGQFMLLCYASGWFRHGKICCLAARNYCMLSCSGLLGLVLWPRVMWQLYSSAKGLVSAFNALLRLCYWPKIFILGLGYIVLLSTLCTRNWLKAHMWVLQVHIMLLLHKKRNMRTWACCWTRQLRPAHNYRKCVSKLRCCMLRDGLSQISSYYTIIMKTQTVGLSELIHDMKAWAWEILWASICIRVRLLEWLLQSKSWIDELVRHHSVISDTKFCGPPLMYRQPSVYSRYSVRFGIHCKARVLCIPRIGLLVSYFWSPEHVSGDEEGGMPPLKV
ncbi:hypothetical protein Hanom_Chr15g01337611 [Helianthus anomalus]